MQIFGPLALHGQRKHCRERERRKKGPIHIMLSFPEKTRSFLETNEGKQGKRVRWRERERESLNGKEEPSLLRLLLFSSVGAGGGERKRQQFNFRNFSADTRKKGGLKPFPGTPTMAAAGVSRER